MNELVRRPTGLILPGNRTRVGWMLPDGLSFDDWVSCGRLLDDVEESIQWMRGDWWVYGAQRRWGDGAAIAEQAGVDYGTMRTYGSVARAYPDLSIRIDKLSFAHHQVAMAAEPEERIDWLRQAEAHEWSVSELRKAISLAKNQAVHEEAAEYGGTVEDLEALIAAGEKFDVIYADPPWQFAAWSHRGDGKGASQHYPCMSIDDICKMPFGKIAADDAALFLWVVQPMLPEALKVIEAWGFEFRTVAFAWIKMNKLWTPDSGVFKPRLGLGYHTRSGMEQCWLAIRGDGYKRQKQGVEQVLHSPLREHSRKPDEIADRIEQLVGGVPKIELFARAQRPGWKAWGNEIPSVGASAGEVEE